MIFHLLFFGVIAAADQQEPCQLSGSFPFYCTEEAAIEASPENAAHQHMGLWMPNGADVMVMDGTYEGDDPICDCTDHDDHDNDNDEDEHEHDNDEDEDEHDHDNDHDEDEHDHDDHEHSHDDHDNDHDEDDGPCQMNGSFPFYCTEEEAIAASPEGAAHTHMGLWMPNGADVMVMDGTYEGDEMMCNCTGTDHDDHDHDDHDHDDHDHEHDDHDHDHEDDGPCQLDGNFPFYCTEEEAIEGSPLGSAHTHGGGLWMPDGVEPHVMDGSYVGDEMTCNCTGTDHDDHDHDDHDHDHDHDHDDHDHDHEDDGPCQLDGNFPFYCTEEEAIEGSPLGSAHTHGGGLWSPDGVEPHVVDGSYIGDEMTCNCTGTDHDDHDHDDHDHDHDDHDHDNDHDEDDGPCQMGGSFPFYCTEEEAIAASPEGAAHTHMGLWMPNGADVMVMDGTYEGDEMMCNCTDHDDHDHDDHDHDHDHDDHDHDNDVDEDPSLGGSGSGYDEPCQLEGSFPFYCTEEAAIVASPEDGAHEHLGLWMPNGADEMVMDGTYEGDEATCDCEKGSDGGSSNKKKSKDANAGMIAGIVIAALILLCCIAGACFYKSKQAKSPPPPVPIVEGKKVPEEAKDEGGLDP